MKPEYKERVTSNIEAITKRANIVLDMMEGRQPAEQDRAIKLMKEIKRLAELSNDIVDIS